MMMDESKTRCEASRESTMYYFCLVRDGVSTVVGVAAVLTYQPQCTAFCNVWNACCSALRCACSSGDVVRRTLGRLRSG
jgi:hypothetical protein